MLKATIKILGVALKIQKYDHVGNKGCDAPTQANTNEIAEHEFTRAYFLPLPESCEIRQTRSK